MPNGTPPEEWGDLELPLLAIDPVLVEFAEAHRLELVRNYHSSPNRMLSRHETDGVVIQLSISPVVIPRPTITYGVFIMAWRDTQDGRYSAAREFARFSNLPKDKSDCLELLESAWTAATQLRNERWNYHYFPDARHR